MQVDLAKYALVVLGSQDNGVTSVSEELVCLVHLRVAQHLWLYLDVLDGILAVEDRLGRDGVLCNDRHREPF